MFDIGQLGPIFFDFFPWDVRVYVNHHIFEHFSHFYPSFCGHPSVFAKQTVTTNFEANALWQFFAGRRLLPT
jgi:hypothetical protein